MDLGRRVYRRAYLFEVIVYSHMALVWAVLAANGFNITQTVLQEFGTTGASVLVHATGGALLRLIVEAFRGRARQLWRDVFTAGWITDTVRIALAGVFTVMVYGWIKLLVPVFHTRLFDQQLAVVDRAICGGFSPTFFLLNVFSNPRALWFFDSAYTRIFFVSLPIAFTFFLSHPSRRIRIAFTTGNAVLWISGAWLYLAVPSLGPAFAFPDVWLAHGRDLPITNMFQAKLMHNYQNVLKFRHGLNPPVTFMFGVAAFPSLHVGFQAFVFLWMRRLWIYGQLVFGLFLLFIFLGSMITGWHYLIDGLAAFVIAGLCYYIFARMYGAFRWLHLRRVISAR